MKLPITLCIITRNSEGRVGTLIDSLKDKVSEVIVCDHDSNDGSKEIAEEKADLVLHRKAKGTADPDRNYVFGLASNPYILYLDDDELLSKEAKQSLDWAVRSDADVVWFVRKNLIDGIDVQEILGPDYQCRLFKNKFKWPEKIHTHPSYNPNSRVFYLNAPIIHTRSLEQVERANTARNPIASEEAMKTQDNFVKAVKELIAKKKEEGVK